MRRLKIVLVDLAPLAIVAALFLLVLRLPEPAPIRRAIPREPRRAECTWYCHNHGCPHRAVLPGSLTGDAGLFGRAIGWLHDLGGVIAPGRRAVGYGAANLIVFCAAWPGAMYGLYLVAVRQRRRLAARRRAERA